MSIQLSDLRLQYQRVKGKREYIVNVEFTSDDSVLSTIEIQVLSANADNTLISVLVLIEGGQDPTASFPHIKAEKKTIATREETDVFDVDIIVMDRNTNTEKERRKVKSTAAKEVSRPIIVKS